MVYQRTNAFSFSLEHVLELNPQLLQGPPRATLYLSQRTGLEPTPPLPPDRSRSACSARARVALRSARPTASTSDHALDRAMRPGLTATP